jgi:hypothetical protein
MKAIPPVDKGQFDALLRLMVRSEPVKRTDIAIDARKPGAILAKPKQ